MLVGRGGGALLLSESARMCRPLDPLFVTSHYNDIIMGSMAPQIASLTVVYSAVYSGADQRKHQSSASLAFVRGIHRGPVNSPHKWPVTRKMFPFDDVIMGTPSGWVFKCWVLLFHLESLSLAEICEIFVSSYSPRGIFVKIWYSGWAKNSFRGYSGWGDNSPRGPLTPTRLGAKCKICAVEFRFLRTLYVLNFHTKYKMYIWFTSFPHTDMI